MRGSPCLHGALDQHGAPFFSEVSTEEGAQEGSQVRATHLTLLGTPTLWTFTPGDLTPSALSQPPQPPARDLTPTALSLPENRNHLHLQPWGVFTLRTGTRDNWAAS